jgi:hypothetical protein
VWRAALDKWNSERVVFKLFNLHLSLSLSLARTVAAAVAAATMEKID